MSAKGFGVSRMGYGDLAKEQLVALLPELLLTGHLIDRSGMAHVIGAYGREIMTKVAIEEWRAASPVYTRRIREALSITDDGVADIFKAMQFDIGAPPQFMDFRYGVTDHDHGEFVLAHCGALIDVEPMGDDYVTGMCHDIEDPTFDATAIATNRRARVRPIHRPPRVPADRTPHCSWTVTIDPEIEELPIPASAERMRTTGAASVALSPIDATEDGLVDYSGPLLSDLRAADWSRSALVRLCEEMALQQHMLAIGFRWGIAEHSGEDRPDILAKQLTGIAGLTAARLREALGVGRTASGLAAVLAAHPLLNPVQYTQAQVELTDEVVAVHLPSRSDATDDGGWLAVVDAEKLDALNAIGQGVDPTWQVASAAWGDRGLTIEFGRGDPADEPVEVAITRFSTGAAFAFDDGRIPLEITPIR